MTRGCTEREHDQTDLKPFEQHALDRESERRPVVSARGAASAALASRASTNS